MHAGNDDALSRRDFLRGVSVAALAAIPGWEFKVPRESGTQDLATAQALMRNSPSFDMHTHPGLFPLKDIPNSANPRKYFGDSLVEERIRQMVEHHVWGGSFTMVLDAPLLAGRRGQVREFEPGEGWREYKRQLTLLDEIMNRHPVRKVVSVVEFEAAHADGIAAAIYACEGGDHLEGDPGRLEELYADGVRHLQPYHYARNPLVLMDGRGRSAGLSQAGRDVIREMNRMGMVIDLGHTTATTTREVAELSTAPIIYSHMRVPGGRRPPDPNVMPIVAQTGGVIGALAITTDIPAFVEGLARMVDMVGIDHVGLGSDMDGNGGASIWDRYGQVPEIAAGLLARGLSEAETAKVLGRNMMRVLRKVVG